LAHDILHGGRVGDIIRGASLQALDAAPLALGVGLVDGDTPEVTVMDTADGSPGPR
jgi:hypothetical protein